MGSVSQVGIAKLFVIGCKAALPLPYLSSHFCGVIGPQAESTCPACRQERAESLYRRGQKTVSI